MYGTMNLKTTYTVRCKTKMHWTGTFRVKGRGADQGQNKKTKIE
jgi:hypothetical protein